jgi:hypothetical protein
MTSKKTSSRLDGRVLAVGLFFLCAAAFSGTVWNYWRNNPLTLEATLQSTGSPAVVKARFPRTSNIHEGKRVVVQIAGDSQDARAGVVTQLDQERWTLIRIESPVTAKPGSYASVSIDGTVGP